MKARLGFDGTTSGTLYGSWEDEIHFNDPKANIEDLMEVPGGSLSDYEGQIELYLSSIGRSRIVGMNRAKSGWSPSGITINYNYLTADAGSDQTVEIDSNTNSVSVSFDGSNSCDPDGGTLTYAWNFGDGDEDTEASTGSGATPSHIYTSTGTYTVELTVTDDENNTDSDSITVTVSEPLPLTLTGPDTVTRGDTATYTASITPAGLTLDTTLTFNWKYTSTVRGDRDTVSITESIDATSQNPQMTTWSGTMVSDGTLEVRTTVNDTEYVKTMDVAVTNRTWVTQVPIATDTTSWGVEAPRSHADLGDVEYDIPFTPADDLDIATVGSGPNKGILYIDSLSLTAPFIVKINKHFGMAADDLPPCWVAFKEANTQYSEIETKVKARLGFDGTTSGTLYGSWESEIHYSDPKANLEEFMEVPGHLSYYETQIVNYVEYTQRTRKAGMARRISRWSPSGITINYNYFAADAGEDQTVNIDTDVNFDGSASCVPSGRTIESYSWDFGSDATPATGTGDKPSCTYSTYGEKTVTLTVTDSEGDTDSDTMTVAVKAPPVADAGDDQTIELDSNTNSVNVSFDGSNSYDPDDGTNPGNGIVSYEWKFGDGSTDSGATPSHTYTSTGTYTVTLTVTDDENQTDSDRITVTVQTLPPVADAGDDQTVSLDSNTNSVSVSFDGSNSYDPDDGTNPGDGIVSYEWKFGDGSTGSGATPSHTYTSMGTYTVTLTVTDDEGATAIDTCIVTVLPFVLTADAGEDLTVSAGSTVTFDGSGSYAPAGRTIDTYAWDFGDESTGSGVRSTHTYNTPGTYTVVLTVTDDQVDPNTATATDNLTLTVFQLEVDGDNTDNSLVFTDDSASGTNSGSGSDGASGASGTGDGGGTRSESGTTTGSTSSTSTAQFTFTLKPADATITTSVHVDIYSSNTNATRVKRIYDVTDPGRTFAASWDGTDSEGYRVPDANYQVRGTATYLASDDSSYSSVATHTVAVSGGSVSVKILNGEVHSNDPESANLSSDTTADVDTVGHGTSGSRSDSATIHYEITGGDVDKVLWRRVLLHIYKVVIIDEKKTTIEVKTVSLGSAVGTRRTAYWGGTDDSDQFSYGEHFAKITIDLNFNSANEPEENEWQQLHGSNSHAITVYSFPVAKAGADQTVYVGEKVTFDGSHSHDPDDGTTPGQGINRYFWDYGDSTISGEGPGSAPTHTYNQPGEFEVTLLVYDNDTPQRVDTDRVTIDSIVEVALSDLTMKRGAPTAITAAITPTTYTPHRIEWVFTKEDGQGTVLSTTTRNTGTTASTTITMVDGDNPYYVEVKLYHQSPGENPGDTIEKVVATDKQQIKVKARGWSVTPKIEVDIEAKENFATAWGDPPNAYTPVELGLLVDKLSKKDHIIRPYDARQWDPYDGCFDLKQIDDPNGPNHGYWYVSTSNIEIDQGILINKHIKKSALPPTINPNGPPPPTNPPLNFYRYNHGRCLNMPLFIQAVINHENAGSGGKSQGHFGRIVQELAKPNKDPSAAIEGMFKATTERDLIDAAEKIIEDIHNDLSDASDGTNHKYVKGNWEEANGTYTAWDPSINDYVRDPNAKTAKLRRCPGKIKL